jgi:hypothetical protein
MDAAIPVIVEAVGINYRNDPYLEGFENATSLVGRESREAGARSGADGNSGHIEQQSGHIEYVIYRKKFVPVVGAVKHQRRLVFVDLGVL